MNLQSNFILLAALTAVCLVTLLVMLFKPDAWSLLVDKENDFWVGRGWLSRSFAEKIKRLEKGMLLKVLLGAAVGIGLVFIIQVLNSASHRQFQAMPPPSGFQPPPHRSPAKTPGH